MLLDVWIIIESPLTMHCTVNPADVPTFMLNVPLFTPVVFVTDVDVSSVKAMVVLVDDLDIVNLITRTPDDPLSIFMYRSPAATFIVAGVPVSKITIGDAPTTRAPISMAP